MESAVHPPFETTSKRVIGLLHLAQLVGTRPLSFASVFLNILERSRKVAYLENRDISYKGWRIYSARDLYAVKEPVVIHKGLDNVYVKESRVCFIDGEASKLFYRGYSIEELAEKSTFEETAYLLIYEHLPTRSQLDEFSKRIASYRSLKPVVLQLVRSFPASSHPMDVLRTAVSAPP